MMTGRNPDDLGLFDNQSILTAEAVTIADVTGHDDELRLPTSLLVDPLGRVQAVYLGPVSGERLLSDLQRWIVEERHPAERAAYPGRWYFRTPRAYGAFAGKLKEAGLESEARYYLGLDHFRTRDPRRGTP